MTVAENQYTKVISQTNHNWRKERELKFPAITCNLLKVREKSRDVLLGKAK